MFADLSRSEEYERALAFIQEQAGKDAELVGVGLSMGGNSLMKIAGMQKEKFPLKAIVTVSNPFDIQLSINLMRGKLSEKPLAKAIRDNLYVRDPATQTEREKKVHLEMIKTYKIDMEKLKRAETWRDLDEELTVKVRT
jgi:predicted alpha/beta-fold hydrolase